jgi:hypothetical protein
VYDVLLIAFGLCVWVIAADAMLVKEEALESRISFKFCTYMNLLYVYTLYSRIIPEMLDNNTAVI